MSGVIFRSDALAVPCPKCGESAGQRCRTLTSGRTTDTHIDRIEAGYVERNRLYGKGSA